MATVPLYVLDTDTLSLYQRGREAVVRAVADHAPDELAITVITVEEQLSGWYTLIRNSRQRHRLALAYQALADNVRFLSHLRIISYTEAAMDRFEELQAQKLNVKTMDLRIAATTLESGGVLISRNLRDFSRVPGLPVADWSR